MALPGILAQLAATVGPEVLSQFLGKRDMKRQQARQDRQTAQSNLIGSLSSGRAPQLPGVLQQQGLASGLASDPLVKKQLQQIIMKLLSKGKSKGK